MALSANKEVIEQEGKLLSLKMAQTTVYKGALVKINAAGYAAPCAPEAGSQFAGVAHEEKVSASAGAAEVRVVTEGAFVMDGSGFAQTNVGDQVYATDDDTVTLTEGTNSKQKVGRIVKVLSSTQVLVKIEAMSGVGASA